MSRKVIVYNTIGDNAKEIITSATTLGELQPDMRRAGVHYDGMKLVVGETQNTLESSEAILPEGEFSLFLMAGKVKSGNDNDYIDVEDGIEWDEVDWSEEVNVEDYTFVSMKDLMIARAKKASYYLDKVVEFMVSSRNRPTSSATTTAETTKNNTLLASLRAEAAKLQNNLDIFN